MPTPSVELHPLIGDYVINHAGVVCGEPSERSVVNHAIGPSLRDRMDAAASSFVTR